MLAPPVTITDDVAFYVAACLAVTCLGLSKGGFIGFGLVATPLLALTVSPLKAAAILLPIMLVQDFISVWAYRRDWDRWNLAVMLPGAIVGIGLAWLLASSIPDSYIRLTVGLIALASAFNNLLGRRATQCNDRPSAIHGVFWGTVSGFTGTLANAAGPPFLIHVLPQRLEKLTFVGTMAIFFAVLSASKIAPFIALGQLSTGNLVTSLVLLPLAAATNMCAIALVRKTATNQFYGIANLTMIVVSLVLIWQGAGAIFDGLNRWG
jgi:uncharacterized membrane protein YfcA